MLIFDNIIFSLQKVGGISRYWSKIIRPYLDSAIFIENNSALQNIYRKGIDCNHIIKDYPLPKNLLRFIPPRISRDRSYLFHSSFYRTSNNPKAKNIVTVHDLIYEKFMNSKRHLPHYFQKKNSLQRADHIVCISRNTRKDLLHYYPETIHKPFSIIPNGIDIPVAKVSQSNVNPYISDQSSTPYFIYVGNRGKLKGFDNVFAALRLPALSDYKCLVIGSKFNIREMAKINALGLTTRLVNLGFIKDLELNYLYQNAKFLFFPSLYEGFGIPLVEAMANSCPVVTTGLASISEIIGDSGFYFVPNDFESLDKAISKCLDNKLASIAIQLGLDKINNYSWEIICEKYDDLYLKYL